MYQHFLFVFPVKCAPCSTSFHSSNELIHHVYNEHEFQPTIYLEHVQSVEEVLNNYTNTTKNKNQKRATAKPKGMIIFLTRQLPKVKS